MAALGLLATTIVVLGGVLAGGSVGGVGGRLWGPPSIPVDPHINLGLALTLFYGGLILLVRAWVQLRRAVLSAEAEGGDRQSLRWSIVGIVVVWAIPFLIGPPLGSRDVYAYEAQGRMAELGYDVYVSGPAVLGDDPAVIAMDPIYGESPVVYGPVFVSISSAVSKATSSTFAAAYAFRLLAVLGLIAAGIGVWDIAKAGGRDPNDALVLAIANPLVLLHLVSGAHNEAIMLGFLVGGVAIGRRWLPLGVALCAIGAAIKIPALVGVGFLAWPWALAAATRWRAAGRVALSTAGTLAVLALAGQATGWGWGSVSAMRGARPVDAYLSITRVIGGAIHLMIGVELDPVLQIVRAVGLALAAGATAYLILRGRQPMPVGLGWSLLVFAVLHPTTQPWYLTWGLLLIAAGSAGARNRALMVLSAFASFVVLPVGPQLGLTLLENTGSALIALIMAGLVLLTFSPGSASATVSKNGGDPGLVTIIVPTRNEAPNIGPMVQRVASSFSGEASTVASRVELLFVDDSDDDTAEVVSSFVERSNVADWDGPRVRLSHRRSGGRWGGLGGAVVDGLAEARGGVAVVIDGDLQHPPEEIPTLLSEIRAGADLVVASRRVAGGSQGAGLTTSRDWMSRGAAQFARALFPERVGRIADPLSGFFAVRMSCVDQAKLHPDGFKILIEMLATHPEVSTTEVPFQFADREEGASKASFGQGVRFCSHLLDLRLRTSRPWAGSVGPQRVFTSS